MIEVFNENGEDVEVIEIDYIEEIEERVWTTQVDLIIIGDNVDTEQHYEKRGQRNTYLYQQVMALKDDYNVTFVTERQLNDMLIKKLMESEFYSIVPITVIESFYEPPSNKNELKELFGGGRLDLPKSKEHKNEDDYLEPPTKTSNLFLPQMQALEIMNQRESIVSVFWSPIPNVGAGTVMRAMGSLLASQGRKVLMIEFDWEYPKLARTTGLTHSSKNLKAALNYMQNNEGLAIQDFVVNNKIADEDLPLNHKEIKARLKKMPGTLFALSRNAELTYEEPINVTDQRIVERIFYQARKAGFEHILVDVASSPNDIFTILSLLVADERFAVVDDSFSTTGFFKMSMETLTNIDITEESFDLIITRIRDGLSGSEIAEYYDMTPILTLPFDDEAAFAQLDLTLELSDTYMDPLKAFLKRYGLNMNMMKEKPKKKLFG